MDALSRLETMAMMSQVELPLHALRAQVASAIDVVVQMNRQLGGRRQVTEIAEVEPIDENGRHKLRPMFRMQPDPEAPAGGRKALTLNWTGDPSALADGHAMRGNPEFTGALHPLFPEPAEEGASP
jgi:pilus assembly protein CpaF